MVELVASGVNKIKEVVKLLLRGDFSDVVKILKYRFLHGDTIVVRQKGNHRWAYISYIPDALIRTEPKSLNSHQNRREMGIIANRFMENGYNIVVQDYKSSRKIPEYDYDVIFGLEPNFNICAKKYNNATKIYYATGAFSGYANSEIIKRTNDFNIKYNCKLPFRRLAIEDDSVEICDEILQIGSNNTVETYPPEIRKKISIIHQSSNFLEEYHYNISKSKINRFLWLGSTGSILKGVDLIIELFLRHPELEVDIVGPVEEEVKAVYRERLRNASNIRFHGFIDVNSELFLEITRGTTFFIYPSVTEGAPGALIVAMKLGLIPIVSKIASPDELDSLGYQLNNLSLESLEDAICWSQSLDNQQIEKMRDVNIVYSRRYSLDTFSSEFNMFLKKITGGKNSLSN